MYNAAEIAGLKTVSEIGPSMKIRRDNVKPITTKLPLLARTEYMSANVPMSSDT